LTKLPALLPGALVLVIALPILPELQGEFPQGLHLVFGAFVPIVKTRIAQEEIGIFEGAANLHFGCWKDLMANGEVPDCFSARTCQECLESVHELPIGESDGSEEWASDAMFGGRLREA